VACTARTEQHPVLGDTSKPLTAARDASVSIPFAPMGGLKKVPSEGGSGGKRGHSGMEHWARTDEIKEAARRVRRKADEDEVEAQLDDFGDAAPAST
jgi:hypothetical protein